MNDAISPCLAPRRSEYGKAGFTHERRQKGRRATARLHAVQRENQNCWVNCECVDNASDLPIDLAENVFEARLNFGQTIQVRLLQERMLRLNGLPETMTYFVSFGESDDRDFRLPFAQQTCRQFAPSLNPNQRIHCQPLQILKVIGPSDVDLPVSVKQGGFCHIS